MIKLLTGRERRLDQKGDLIINATWSRLAWSKVELNVGASVPSYVGEGQAARTAVELSVGESCGRGPGYPEKR